MANFVTVSYGLVTRETSTSGDLPVSTVSDDPWIDVSGMNPRPVIGDHYDGTDFTLDHTALSVAQGTKVGVLRDACAHHIKHLGYCVWFDDDPPIYYVFPSESKDQSNVHAASIAAQVHVNDTPPWTASLWCGIGTATNSRIADASQWTMRDLTVTQIGMVAHVMHAHIADAQEVLMTECDVCCAATTVAAVNAIVWEPPNS